MSFFEIKNIEKNYSNHKALDDVSINIEKGSIFGLLGPNGAGKTTLIRIINQITAPDKGTVWFDGEQLNAKHIANIGYLPEERGLYKKMKVGEQAVYLAQLKGLSKKQALRELKKWFEKFEIQAWWDKKVEELSKGMQQKVQFIITILHKPELLIFDEPFSGFDPINANLLKNEILELRNQGSTIIFSTHNMASVEEICDHIALINLSKKILDGQIDEVREKYKSNTFEVVFDGDFNKMGASLTSDFELIDIEKENGHTKVKYRILSKASANDLITFLLQFGKIKAFNEIIPNMNDVFIQVVNENKTERINSNDLIS